MDELAPTGGREQAEPSGTRVGKFLANRGVIIEAARVHLVQTGATQ